MLNNQAFEQIGPIFRDRGWVFFAPYRRGQGLSASAGPFIGDEIARAQKESAWRIWPVVVLCAAALLALLLICTRRSRNWLRIVSVIGLIVAVAGVSYASHVTAGANAMVTLLESDHLDDHLAALNWLKQQPFVQPNRIATGGNSFGGIITLLGAERTNYCAAIDAAGGAQSWMMAPQLRSRMAQAVHRVQAPVFFFQAANDYSLAPSRNLSAEMVSAGRTSQLRIYPRFGATAADGHSFAWRGSAVRAKDVFKFLDKHCAG
jgi:carboxymethylenebutenolidase